MFRIASGVSRLRPRVDLSYRHSITACSISSRASFVRCPLDHFRHQGCHVMATWKKPSFENQALLDVLLRRRPRSCGQTISSYSQYGIPVPRSGISHSLILYSCNFQSTIRALDNVDKARKVCIVYIFTDPRFYTIIMIVNVTLEGQFMFIDFLDLRI